jgi:hypothetical protein
MILGLAASYLALAARCTPSSAERISSRLTVRIIFVSICALILLHFYTKFNARFN